MQLSILFVVWIHVEYFKFSKSSRIPRFSIADLCPKQLVAISHELHPCLLSIVQRSVAKCISLWLILPEDASHFLWLARVTFQLYEVAENVPCSLILRFPHSGFWDVRQTTQTFQLVMIFQFQITNKVVLFRWALFETFSAQVEAQQFSPENF